MADEELPPVVARLVGDISDFDESFGSAIAKLESLPGKASEASRGLSDAFGAELTDSIGAAVGNDLPAKLDESLRKIGHDSADTFGRSFNDEIPEAFRPNVFGDGLTGLMSQQGESAGREFTATFSHVAEDEIMRSTLAGMLDPDGPVGEEIVNGAGDTGREAGKKMGDEAGKSAGDGMSPLIVSAIVGAAAIGAPLLVAGVDAAFSAITVKALASNKVISADFTRIGADADKALQQAVSPLAPEVHQALSSIDVEIGTLKPTLDGLFANAGPDIGLFATGIGNLASGLLPGLSTALGNSHDLVGDVAASMGQLGTGVGSFLAGLTRDSATTGRGLEAVIGTASTALGTLGNIAGSASSAISADLLAITPAVNVALQAIDKLSSPETVGAAAGAFAAWKLGSPIQSGLQSISNGFTNVAVKAVESGGLIGKTAGAAEGAASGFGKMADVMGGPWGIAIGAGIGLLSGLAGSLMSASHATDAVTLSQQNLTDAVSKDSGAAGQNTAALVAQTLASSGLSDAASQAGVSTTTWTEAVLGNKDAQQQVVDAVNKTNQAQQQQQLTTDENARSAGKFSGELQDATTSAQAAAVASNKYTDANQKLINTLNAETKQVADAIAADSKYESALNQIDSSSQIFNATLTAVHKSLVANAQQSALNTVGALNLGNSNFQLSDSLYQTVTAYNEAQSEGNAYLQTLQALDGSENSLLGTEAAFTMSLGQLSDAVKANGTSLDVNNVKGAANITMFTNAANAADKAAASVYQNEVNTKGATTAFDDANTKLAEEKTAFEQAAEKAGYNKTQVQELANELFKLPKNVPVGVDTTNATKGLAHLISQINSSSGTVKIYENSSGDVISTNTKVYAKAGGGPVGPGETYLIGENGPEIMQFGGSGYITPNNMIAPLMAGSGGGGGVGAPGVAPIIISINAGTMIGSSAQFANTVQQAMGRLGMRVANQYASYGSTRGR